MRRVKRMMMMKRREGDEDLDGNDKGEEGG